MAAFKLLITLFFVSMVMVPSANGIDGEICQTDVDCMRTYAGYCSSDDPQAYCKDNVCHCVQDQVRCDTNQDCAGRIPCRTGGRKPTCIQAICLCVNRPPTN